LLQRAAAADIEMRAARRHPIGAGNHDVHELRLVVPAVAPPAAKADGVCRQRSGGKYRFAAAHDSASQALRNSA
ncbi:MAG: hypothetical protein WA446_18335, partial [Steroidobacteraceae bacterium]